MSKAIHYEVQSWIYGTRDGAWGRHSRFENLEGARKQLSACRECAMGTGLVHRLKRVEVITEEIA